MGKTFYDLTCEELCDLMCGNPDPEEKENRCPYTSEECKMDWECQKCEVEAREWDLVRDFYNDAEEYGKE